MPRHLKNLKSIKGIRAWLGLVWLGLVGLGWVGFGLVWLGLVGFGSVKNNVMFDLMTNPSVTASYKNNPACSKMDYD